MDLSSSKIAGGTNLSACTTRESISPADNSSSVKSILKQSSWNHKIARTASEITALKKVSSASRLEVFKQERPKEEPSIEDVQFHPQTSPPTGKSKSTLTLNPEDRLANNKFTLRKSEEIVNWANRNVALRKKEFDQAAKAFEKLKGIPTDKAVKQELKKNLSLIKDHFKKAEKYAEWAMIRDEILKGDQELAQRVREGGWSLDAPSNYELEEDWKGVLEEEPWAKENSQYQELITTIDTLVDQYLGITKAKVSALSPTQDLQEPKEQTSPPAKTESIFQKSSEEYEPNMVFVPGTGYLDRNTRDIAHVEDHEDGTHTITDMTGRRYDYQPPTKPGASCTIS